MWFGAPLLLAATLISIVRGYDNLPGELGGRKEWHGAEVKQLNEVLDIARKTRKWDQSVLDITCFRGGAVFVAAAIALVVVYQVLSAGGEVQLCNVIFLDAVLILAPHWFTGVRRILTNAPLTVKVQELLYVHDLWTGHHADDEQMAVQMEVVKAEKGEVPSDAKLILKFPQLGDAFLGLQVQGVLNNVQGSDYPYVYCVLVAKPELGMLKKLDPQPPSNVMVEKKCQQDVEIIIVRQYTTETSGYHTDRSAIGKIFNFARSEARKLLTA
jgi:hypothetical protein